MPRKSLKERQNKKVTGSNTQENRIRPILEDLRRISSPDKKMNMIMEAI